MSFIDVADGVDDRLCWVLSYEWQYDLALDSLLLMARATLRVYIFLRRLLVSLWWVGTLAHKTHFVTLPWTSLTPALLFMSPSLLSSTIPWPQFHPFEMNPSEANLYMLHLRTLSAWILRHLPPVKARLRVVEVVTGDNGYISYKVKRRLVDAHRFECTLYFHAWAFMVMVAFW